MAAASAARSGRTGRSSGPRPRAIAPRRRGTSRRSGRARNQRNGNFSTSTIGGQPVRIFNPWCRGGVASARCPATGTGSIETGGEFTGGDHPAQSPGRQPGRVQPRERLSDGGYARQPDRPERGQPGQREHDRRHPRQGRHVEHQGRAQVHRPMVPDAASTSTTRRPSRPPNRCRQRTTTWTAPTTCCSGGRTCWCSTTRTS